MLRLSSSEIPSKRKKNPCFGKNHSFGEDESEMLGMSLRVEFLRNAPSPVNQSMANVF